MVSVSKEESMLLIKHAISACQNEGKTQKELGELLGIDGSRISEGKIGKWKLSPSQRQVIIDNYGYPRRGKGQYIKAEVYDTVTEFIDDYDESSKLRFKRRMYELLKRKDYQKLILNLSGSKQELNISFIDKLLSQPESKKWYDSMKNYKHYRSGDNACELGSSFEVLLNSVGFCPPSNIIEPFKDMLYHIALFKFELMPNFSFSNNEDVPSAGLKDLVITGDEVLNFKADCRNVSFNAAADIFGHRDRLYEFPIFKSDEWLVPEETEINCKPDNWDRVILRLYLSEDMHYHLWIRLDDVCHIDKSEMDCDTENYERFHAGVYEDGLVRNIVIKNLCHINYLKEIEMIRKWCGWPFDFNDDIKREVAKVGGYVPGAEVL